MNFNETTLPGVFLIEPDIHADERGSFARTFCLDEFDAAGIRFGVVQANISFNQHSGTVRGMHFQRAPHGEGKVVRCTAGSMYDVIVDLRPDSPTFCQWVAAELNAENRKAIYAPEGCAHGFQTLSDSTEVSYLMSERYAPEAATGVRFDDPAFEIDWPLPVSNISARDRDWPNFDTAQWGTGQ
jgi:dTDP-4-dehydrorhamnose 3,5-epimerase